jgi:carbon-monoxide dehydrogenase large subunit
MVMGGGAVARRSRLVAARAARIGAWLLQADAADAKVVEGRVVAGNGSVTLREVARAWYLQPQNLPPDVDTGGLEVTAGYRAERDSGTFSYATHAAVVAVDPQTGLIEILDYVVVEDGGILVNPMIVDGQVCGGTAQGIGTCLYEAMPFDAQGQPLASTMLDYMLPGADRSARHPRPAHGDAFALHGVRHKGLGRRRGCRPTGGDRLGGQRRAARRSVPRSMICR